MFREHLSVNAVAISRSVRRTNDDAKSLIENGVNAVAISRSVRRVNNVNTNGLADGSERRRDFTKREAADTPWPGQPLAACERRRDFTKREADRREPSRASGRRERRRDFTKREAGLGLAAVGLLVV